MDTPLDPNWFYSSLAQAAASVVGLVAGILVTRLQGDIKTATSHQIQTTEVLRKLDKRARKLMQCLSSEPSSNDQLAQQVVVLLDTLLNTATQSAIQDFHLAIAPLLGNRPNSELERDLRKISKLAAVGFRRLQVLHIHTGSTFQALWWCLVALSSSGLILPLLFLSAYSSLHRVLLVSVFAISITVLLSYLRSRILRLAALGRYHSLLPPNPEIHMAA
jgi:hypothetical protein